MKDRILKVLQTYLKDTHWLLQGLDVLKVAAAVVAWFGSLPLVLALAQRPDFQAGLHRRIFSQPDFATSAFVYGLLIRLGASTFMYWMVSTLRNFIRITRKRYEPTEIRRKEADLEIVALPEWPYRRDAFALVLGELEDRDGSRVPSMKSPDLVPRWLIFQEKALYTGFFITGGIGSGKTAGVGLPGLDQLLGMERPVKVLQGGQESVLPYRFSGLVMDEKGDFCNLTETLMKKWGREDQFIRLSPGGKTLWNPIYNPAIPTWAVGYQLSQILRRVDKGRQGGDPFWEKAPRELLIDYLVLLDRSQGYYTITDYLKVLANRTYQEEHYEAARARWADSPKDAAELDVLWRRIKTRNDETGQNLLGSLVSCAKAGLELFAWPEIYKTFCPSREEYFLPPEWDEGLQDHVQKPRPNVFTGFDAILETGHVVGLDMPKSVYFDAANFIQVALKAQWQDAVMRRDTNGPDGNLLVQPRFGPKVGYAPTFLMSDECQENVVPQDQQFLAQCRSKRASCWWITQSHSSIRDAFGETKEAAVDAFVQNNMTHIYLRQSDMWSMERIEKEVGLKDVAKTTVGIVEGGRQSDLNYAFGNVVNEGMAVSESKQVTIEEKPFFEKEDMKRLPDFVAIVLPSTGEVTLPATMCFLRPSWVFQAFPDLTHETSWYDWPEALRKRVGLDNLPQTADWSGWGTEAVDLDANGTADLYSGGFRGVKVRAVKPRSSSATGGPGKEPDEPVLAAVLERAAQHETVLGEGPRKSAPLPQVSEGSKGEDAILLPAQRAAEAQVKATLEELEEEEEVPKPPLQAAKVVDLDWDRM